MENKKKILVIGAHSYIAQNLEAYVKKKKKNWEIRLATASDGGWKKLDFTGYDSILIAAALVHKKETKEKEELYCQINKEMPIEIARKSKSAKIKQLIFLSSMSVFGEKIERISLDTKPEPISFYGKSKYEAEQELLKMKEKDFQIAIVRPPMVYGEGCPGNYGRLKKLAKITPIFPDTKNKRSMIAVETLCGFLIELIETQQTGYFHPQDSHYINTAEMVKEMRSEMGKRTYLTTAFNWILCPLSKRIGVLRKLFGDLWYE